MMLERGELFPTLGLSFLRLFPCLGQKIFLNEEKSV